MQCKLLNRPHTDCWKPCDMEVAGQWRREWAGSAEYGKVTEGGVTRRVARALEVLQSSGPGSRMRVLRAAYHSTAGPGAPAHSFLMHSSRRVISSGSNFLESPSFMTSPMSKPLEIASMPLDSTPERFSEGENYKVTEPDDSEISEPSKWRSSTGASSARLPSEESSSADNASIIDLTKNTNGYRKSSFDSDSSDLHKSSTKRHSRTSPLLDAPVTLSTLKYKSLLNGTSDSWNDRRKSYSFEDTSPLNETILHKNDTLAMDSSTDSGICKSSEIVNENTEDKFTQRYFDRNETIYEGREETFKDWLAKNRLKPLKETPFSLHKENYETEDPVEKIALQSTGKVSIALPMDNQTSDRFQYTKNHILEEDRRVKRVEFCKTELHFAADSGRVNIIATDEKPPPSNDFRRRKSAFVPINGAFDKTPITLYGEKSREYPDDFAYNDDEYDENNSSTKSILKNKIPKPKPYLLGENMVLGQVSNETNERLGSKREYIIPTAVSLINKQLHPDEKTFTRDTTSRLDSHTRSSFADYSVNVIRNNKSRATPEGPSFDTTEENDDSNYFSRLKSGRNSFRSEFQEVKNEVIGRNNTNSIKQKLRNLQTSPVMQKSPKTRQLRDSDLTYFGINNSSTKQKSTSPSKSQSVSSSNKQQRNPSPANRASPKYDSQNTSLEKTANELQSVKLIQRVSNSVCNSEAESEDTPEYQNFPIKTNFALVPIPRARTKVVTDFSADTNDDYKEEKSERVVILKPIIEQRHEVAESNIDQGARRTKYRRQNVTSNSSKSRSISEPPKYRQNALSLEKPRRDSSQQRASNTDKNPTQAKNDFKHQTRDGSALKKSINQGIIVEDEPALYVNIDEENIYDQPARLPKKLEKAPSDKQPRKQSRDKVSSIINSEGIMIQKPKGSPQSKSDKIINSFDRGHVLNKSGKVKDKSSSYKTTGSLYNDRKVPNDTEHKAVDNHSSERKQHQHRHRSAHDTSTRNSPKKGKEEKYDSVGKLRHIEKAEAEAKLDDKNSSKNRDRSRSKENQDTKEIIVIPERYHKTKKVAPSESEASLTTDKNKRLEYVINYDDKNGTVSSICQLKPGHPKRKIIHPEKTKEIKMKTKSSDKSSLLQYQEPQWMLYAANNGKRKAKTNVYQRTCTIL